MKPRARYKRVFTLPILRAHVRQVRVIADLLVEPQGLLERALFLRLALDLARALQ